MAQAESSQDNVTIETVKKKIAVNRQEQIAQFDSMMKRLGIMEDKEFEKYTRVFSDSQYKHGAKKRI